MGQPTINPLEISKYLPKIKGEVKKLITPFFQQR
jgi:hypothetical protein